MDWLTAFLNQTATLWVSGTLDGYGNPSFAAPVQIPCRWEGKTEKLINGDGSEVVSRARVFLAQDVKEGDYLYLGTAVGANPKVVIGAYAVRVFAKVPALDASDFERKAYL